MADIGEVIGLIKALSVGKGAFSNCSNLKSINIPESVTSINNYAFHKIIPLKSSSEITVTPREIAFCSLLPASSPAKT